MSKLVQKIIYTTLGFLLTINFPCYATNFQINEEKSKLTYSLSEFGIVFKRKPLPMKGFIQIEKDLLKKIVLTVRFTSKNPFFRRFIEYDKYPDFTFSSTLDNPILIKNQGFITVKGKVTFHGITKEIKINLENTSTNSEFVFKGPINIKMTEFGLTPPRFLFFRVDDKIETEVEIYSTPIYVESTSPTSELQNPSPH